MASRLPSFLTKALLATVLVGAGQVYAADTAGIVVYNAQHESLTKAVASRAFFNNEGRRVVMR